MANLAAQAYEVLGGEPPPGHELLAVIALHRTGAGKAAATALGGPVGAVAAAKRAEKMPSKSTNNRDARDLRKAQDALGLTNGMVWGVNRHNLLVFKAGGLRGRTPVKLAARIPVEAVTVEAHHKNRLAVTLRGVAVEVAGETKPMTEFVEALRSALGTPPAS